MPRNVSITYTCDICGVPVPEEAAYSFIVAYAHPGPGLKSFLCPEEQHYGCTPEHAAQAAKACIEHLEVLRQEKANV